MGEASAAELIRRRRPPGSPIRRLDAGRARRATRLPTLRPRSPTTPVRPSHPEEDGPGDGDELVASLVRVGVLRVLADLCPNLARRKPFRHRGSLLRRGEVITVDDRSRTSLRASPSGALARVMPRSLLVGLNSRITPRRMSASDVPSREPGTGLAPACWRWQKPVRPARGVTRHSSAARGSTPQTGTGTCPPTWAGGRSGCSQINWTTSSASTRTETRTRSGSSTTDGAVVFEAAVGADNAGYAEALRFAELHAPSRRAFGRRGCRFLRRRSDPLPRDPGEQVFEVGRVPNCRRVTSASRASMILWPIPCPWASGSTTTSTAKQYIRPSPTSRPMPTTALRSSTAQIAVRLPPRARWQSSTGGVVQPTRRSSSTYSSAVGRRSTSSTA